MSLSRAAKLLSRFAAVENGSSPAVSMYLQRAADSFNHLVQFHSKGSKTNDFEKSPHKRGKKSKAKNSTTGDEKKQESVVNTVEEVEKALKSEEKEQKKREKKRSVEDDSNSKRDRKKRKIEADNS